MRGSPHFRERAPRSGVFRLKLKRLLKVSPGPVAPTRQLEQRGRGAYVHPCVIGLEPESLLIMEYSIGEPVWKLLEDTAQIDVRLNVGGIEPESRLIMGYRITLPALGAQGITQV